MECGAVKGLVLGIRQNKDPFEFGLAGLLVAPSAGRSGICRVQESERDADPSLMLFG